MRTEDELRQALSQAAQQSAAPATNARAAVGRRVRRQRVLRLGAVAGMAAAIAAFTLVSVTRPDHRASVRVVGPGPSPTAVAGPQPDTSSSPTTSQSGTAPPGFSAVSVTFVSPNDGFVLGSAPCATPPCTVILRTADTGKTWHRIGAPPVAVASDAAPRTAHRIRFATTRDGWVFGPDLWSTHDGGDHWSQQQHHGDVEDLESAAGAVHMVVLATNPNGAAYEILSTPVASDEWTKSALTLAKGAAPIAGAQIVLQGRSGWVLISERVVEGGAKLGVNGWAPWRPPCTQTFGPAVLMAPTPSQLAAVCLEGVWGGNLPQGTGLYLSEDAGTSFSRVGTVPSNGGDAANPVPGAVVAVRSDSGRGGKLIATFDSGKSWITVDGFPPQSSVGDLGFTTPTEGIAVVTGPELSHLIMTTDGGHHWHSVPFE